MNRTQINKIRMYSATNMVLENHAGIISGFPELLEVHSELQQSLGVIDQNRQVQETDTTGLTLEKTVIRQRVNKLILQFSAALLAYATINKNNELKMKATYKNSDLIHAADPILYDIGFLLLNLARPVQNDIQRFSLSPQDFDDLEQNLNQFKQSIPQKRVATGTSKVSTKNIDLMFKTIDDLLKNKIDILMLHYQFSNPDFYNEYKSARLIVGYTGGGKGGTSAEEPPK